jgi:hypothetical protein
MKANVRVENKEVVSLAGYRVGSCCNVRSVEREFMACARLVCFTVAFSGSLFKAVPTVTNAPLFVFASVQLLRYLHCRSVYIRTCLLTFSYASDDLILSVQAWV